MGDKDNLKDTFRGVDALYIVTPPVENRAQLVIQTAEGAKEAGVKFLLIISGLIGYPDTILGRQYSQIEGKISHLGVPYSFLRFPFYLENIWGYKDTIKTQSAIYGPLLPDKPYSAISVEDAGKVGAVILSDYTKHGGKSYAIASDRYTNTELASTFSEVLGKDVKYIQVPYEATKQTMIGKGFPDWQAEGVLELLKLIYSGASEITNIDISLFKTLTGEEPTSLKAWVAKYGAAFK